VPDAGIVRCKAKLFLKAYRQWRNRSIYP